VAANNAHDRDGLAPLFEQRLDALLRTDRPRGKPSLGLGYALMSQDRG
jgi:hypothetical protein